LLETGSVEEELIDAVLLTVRAEEHEESTGATKTTCTDLLSLFAREKLLQRTDV
jgi:hypothetical protein